MALATDPVKLIAGDLVLHESGKDDDLRAEVGCREDPCTVFGRRTKGGTAGNAEQVRPTLPEPAMA